ncbi:hypothetical protein M426DRAFT_316517 [Hypoxylon sp. CI-4A]|nr:hypothetical protein M426DRAFT_316517 [Hypoxylon sp. CI-4A]
MSTSSSAAVANNSRTVHSRTQSISSDRPSTIGHNLMSPPLSVTPEAVFIAASAASQIVTNDHDSHSETWYDQMGIAPSEETALVSQSALQLANNFVDQLLFNIIAVAKSTSLSALRPAVSEVLKPKLAKDVVNNADEELREYLGGGEVEDLAQSPITETPGDWDLELVWKRTRLRCMVYSSLGDMEEEDEDYYMEQEHLRGESDDIGSDLVSPAVAIFLTSILEFMGEQVLVIAGQAAFNRLRLKYEKEAKEGTQLLGELFERIVVEELDMERVALDRTIGRLWRSWKKRIRSPLEPNYSRPFSRSSTGASGLSGQRRGSSATDRVQLLPTPRDSDTALEVQEEQGAETTSEETSGGSDERVVDPADLPLPDSDVEATYSDEEESEDERDDVKRPKSLVIFPLSAKVEPASQEVSAKYAPVRRARSLPSRRRPRYPSPAASRHEVDADERKDEGKAEEDPTDKAVSQIVTESVSKEAETSSGLTSEEATQAQNEIRVTKQRAVKDEAKPKIGIETTHAISHSTNSGIRHTETEEEIDEFEEPEILTSSRISIGGSIGGRSSPATSESGRPAPLMPIRSNSVHSVRVIEVQSPRSPSASSRASFADFQDQALSTRRISTPPIAEENDSSARSSKRNTVILQPSLEESQDTNVVANQPTRNPSPLRSVQSQPASQLSVPPTTTKVSIVSGPEVEVPSQERPRAPSKSRTPPMPTLPERSTSRPVYGRSISTGAPSERSARRGSPESPEMPLPVAPSDSPSSTSTKLKIVRTSEDGSSRRSEDRARDFEQLIHSNETLQYTLTPENMRDIDSTSIHQNGSPKHPGRTQRNENAKYAERSRSSSLKSLKRSVSITKQTSLGSHPPTDLPISRNVTGSTSKAPISVPPKGRSAVAPQAREARIPRESLQDFADFIRSTGPPGDQSTQYNRANMSARMAPSVAVPGHVGKSPSVDSRRTNTTMRSNHQARDAAVNPASENSDLIDFIRRGPPNNNGNNPRIPRHVAPFRTTMDSDQMQMTGAVGGKAIDAVLPTIRNSETSTNFTETSAPSSMNSQSALLSKANKVQQQYTTNNFDDDDMMPKRTQRRVRDPYAIDFSDDDDIDDLDMTPKPKPKPKKEESLIDFLNNYAPPPEPKPEPVPIPKKKSSAPNLIARLRSGGNSISKSSSGPNSKGINPTDSRSLSSRAGTSKGYTPIVIPQAPSVPSVPSVPSGAGNFGSGARQPPPVAPSGPSGRVPMKRFEPRDAASGASRTSGTSDLASFLRDSEPPPQPVQSPPSATETKSSGFAGIFGRRKKSSAF